VRNLDHGVHTLKGGSSGGKSVKSKGDKSVRILKNCGKKDMDV